MRFPVLLTSVTLLWSSVLSLKVVQYDLDKRYDIRSDSIQKRDPFAAALYNDVPDKYYTLNISIGTPPQNFTVQLDTGSSDLWVNNVNAANCHNSSTPCLGGTYDSSASSTFQQYLPGAFHIAYGDDPNATISTDGDYVLDTVQIQGHAIMNQTFGLANSTSNSPNYGVMGVSFASGEAICNSSSPCPRQYPSVIDSMASQGLINTRAYSLWLNGFNDTSGSILFGGVDSSKYSGDLVALPLQPDPYFLPDQTVYDRVLVDWSGFSISTPDGDQIDLWPADDYSTEALLDSGTADAVFPPLVFEAIADFLGATQSAAGYLPDLLVPCSYLNLNVSFNFQFGGANGVSIAIPISEIIFDAPGTEGLSYKDGQQACRLGISPAPSPYSFALLGDTFLRSAYVVYDLENNQVAMAQANHNEGASNIQEINSNGIPGVSVTATASVVPSQTENLTPTGPAQPTYTPGSATVLSQTGTPPLYSHVPSSILASVTASGSASATSTQKGDAASLRSESLPTWFTIFMSIMGIAFW